MVTFFCQKAKVLAMFREHSKLEIKNLTTTCFAYMWIVFSRLHEVKVPLRQTAVSAIWNDWDESSMEESKSMQRLCLDESFLDSLKAILSLITSIYKDLWMTDFERVTLGLFVHVMRIAIQEIREYTLVNEDQKNEILEIRSFKNLNK
ncbi:hypothetical protein KP509_07G086400 [Ceratopteris richardii]|uniref:Uncharacterized protein n=1 Tax=Ceratopteris richardii TaxID=49495 RepID=A0A8T2UCV4_CERRI|nr:hypothetical protein KP509_07G086400 [Ceratopteris richardii]